MSKRKKSENRVKRRSKLKKKPDSGYIMVSVGSPYFSQAIARLYEDIQANLEFGMTSKVYGGIMFIRLLTNGKEDIFIGVRNGYLITVVQEIKTRHFSATIDLPFVKSLGYNSVEEFVGSDEFLDDVNAHKEARGFFPLQQTASDLFRVIREARL
ncbi:MULTISPECIES: hypothetical protein [Olivibacter]|uniref:Uncharacterized protein n=1 Tax=Olivibacter jilunii TaxID=985016 RepID=A0ABW6AXV9_9SPHI